MPLPKTKHLTLTTLTLSTTLLLGACSMNTTEITTPETNTQISTEFEEAVLDTVNHSGIKETDWNYSGGKIFSADYFHGRVPYMGNYCADDQDETKIYKKSIKLKTTKQLTTQEYEQKIQDMQAHWESQGHQPYIVGSDSESQKIAYRTSHNVLVQYYAGETGLMILAQTPCALPSPSPQPTPSL